MQIESTMDLEMDSVWLLAGSLPFGRELPFIVNEAGYFNAKPSYCIQHQNRTGYLLLYTAAGEGALKLDGQEYHLTPGSLLYLKRTTPHELYSIAPQGSWQFYWLHLEGLSTHFYYETLFPAGRTGLVHCPGTLAEEHFKSILEQVETPSRDALCSISNSVSAILTAACSYLRQSSHQQSGHFEAVQQTVEYIKENYRQPLEISELAAMVKLSKYYYIKVFRDVTQTTPYEYILQYRINQSRKLLRSTHYKASEIAQMVGFADECNFSRTFKRLTGTTPLQYRKNA